MLHTHVAKSFSPSCWSIAAFPVTNSRMTTPKLYVSLFSLTRSVYAYSAKELKIAFSELFTAKLIRSNSYKVIGVNNPMFQHKLLMTSNLELTII